MRNASSNASIYGYKGPTLDWWAVKCSVDMVSPKTTRTDAIRSPIDAIGMADTRSVPVLPYRVPPNFISEAHF